MSNDFFESVVEEAALSWLEDLDYKILPGPDTTSVETFAERESYHEIILKQRLQDSLVLLNPSIPSDTLEEALRKLTRPESPSLTANNRAFHRMLVEGVQVEYRRKDGSIAGDRVRLVDFEHPENNDFLAVNQFTVAEGQHSRRADIVVFVNGLPLAVIELKNPADEDATIWSAFNQLQTYKQQIPSLFTFNEALVISDGLEARLGTLTADKERFSPWRTVEGEETAPASISQLEVLDPRSLREAPLSGPAPLLHRLRGQGRPDHQEDGRLPPVPRRPKSPAGHAESLRPCGGQALRCGLAHPGLGKEPHHGILRWASDPGTGHGEPDHHSHN